MRIVDLDAAVWNSLSSEDKLRVADRLWRAYVRLHRQYINHRLRLRPAVFPVYAEDEELPAGPGLAEYFRWLCRPEVLEYLATGQHNTPAVLDGLYAGFMLRAVPELGESAVAVRGAIATFSPSLFGQLRDAQRAMKNAPALSQLCASMGFELTEQIHKEQNTTSAIADDRRHIKATTLERSQKASDRPLSSTEVELFGLAHFIQAERAPAPVVDPTDFAVEPVPQVAPVEPAPIAPAFVAPAFAAPLPVAPAFAAPDEPNGWGELFGMYTAPADGPDVFAGILDEANNVFGDAQLDANILLEDAGAEPDANPRFGMAPNMGANPDPIVVMQDAEEEQPEAPTQPQTVAYTWGAEANNYNVSHEEGGDEDDFAEYSWSYE